MIWGAGAALLLAPAGTSAEATNTTPDFQEVYDLIRAHLAGETQADLDRAAVQGLLTQLRAKVSLVAPASATNADTDAPLLLKAGLYDGPVGYLRVGRVADGLPALMGAACRDLAATNQLKGLVLDLRFADGHDYQSAAAIADLFLGKEVQLLDWGSGFAHSKAKTDAIALPIAILVNQKTAAAAEALAAVLRQVERGVIIGSATAGEATMDQIFPLKNGQSLRVATAAVKLGSGETLSASGLTPDISVAVSPADEHAYFQDPFRQLNRPSDLLASLGMGGAGTNGGTNHLSRARPTEADLIRDRRQNPGREVEYSVSPGKEAAVEKPVIRDPVLGRALDLLKVISVLRSPHPA